MSELNPEYTSWITGELKALLPKAQHTKIPKIVALICPEDGVFHTVETRGTAVGIETVEAYGLTLKLDANGDAAQITFPYGAEVIA